MTVVKFWIGELCGWYSCWGDRGMWTVRLPVRGCDRSWIRTWGFLHVFSCSHCHHILLACALPPAPQLPPTHALAPVENSMVPFPQGKGLCLMLSRGEQWALPLHRTLRALLFKTYFSCYEIPACCGFLFHWQDQKKMRLKIIHDPSTASKIQFCVLPLAVFCMNIDVTFSCFAHTQSQEVSRQREIHWVFSAPNGLTIILSFWNMFLHVTDCTWFGLILMSRLSYLDRDDVTKAELFSCRLSTMGWLLNVCLWADTRKAKFRLGNTTIQQHRLCRMSSWVQQGPQN